MNEAFGYATVTLRSVRRILGPTHTRVWGRYPSAPTAPTLCAAL